MVTRQKEIFIRINDIDPIIDVLSSIKLQQEALKRKFAQYDELNLEENKIFENWNTYLEEIEQKLSYVRV